MTSYITEEIQSALDELASRLVEDHERDRQTSVRAVNRYYAYLPTAEVRAMVKGNREERKALAAGINARPELWDDYR